MSFDREKVSAANGIANATLIYALLAAQASKNEAELERVINLLAQMIYDRREHVEG